MEIGDPRKAARETRRLGESMVWRQLAEGERGSGDMAGFVGGGPLGAAIQQIDK